MMMKNKTKQKNNTRVYTDELYVFNIDSLVPGGDMRVILH